MFLEVALANLPLFAPLPEDCVDFCGRDDLRQETCSSSDNTALTEVSSSDSVGSPTSVELKAE